MRILRPSIAQAYGTHVEQEVPIVDPRALRMFLAVCREGSISGAARKLVLSQPSVSIAMRQLERSLGAILFERGPKSIALTAAGDALRLRAEMLDAVIEDAGKAVCLAMAGVSGPLRVGGTPGALVSLLPAALARMGDSRRMSLHVVERSEAQLTQDLRRGEIELAMMTTGMDAPPDDIEEISIARDPFSLVVGESHGAIGEAVRLRDMAQAGWVLPREAGAFHRQIEALFHIAEVAVPTDVIRCDSLPSSKEIVRRTARVTVLPRGVVAAELAMGVLRAISIEDARISRNIGIRKMRGRPHSPLGALFLQALLDERV